MKFTHTGMRHSGQSISMTLKDHYSTYDQSALSEDTSCIIDIERATPHDTTQLPKLSINWVYSIYYHGMNVFTFDTEERFDVSEFNIEPERAMIKDILTSTASYFVNSYNERHKEYNFLRKMDFIPSGQIEQHIQPVLDALTPLSFAGKKVN